MGTAPRGGIGFAYSAFAGTTGSTDLEGRADRCRVSLFGTNLIVSAFGADRNASKFLSRLFISSNNVVSSLSRAKSSNPDSTLKANPLGMSLFPTFNQGLDFG